MSAGPAILPAAVYRVAVAPREVAESVRLRAAEWGVLFAASGEHTVAQIGGRLGLAPTERDRAFARLVELGLLVERPLDLGDYLRATASAGDDGAVALAEFLLGAPARPLEPGAAGRARATPEAARAALPAAQAMPAPFRPLPLPGKERLMNVEGAPPESTRKLRLRSLIEFIVGRAESVEQGQLDVYRTFLRVDPKLLRRQGITTLRFEDDRVVTDPELVEQIAASVRETVGVPCPADLFA